MPRLDDSSNSKNNINTNNNNINDNNNNDLWSTQLSQRGEMLRALYDRAIKVELR